MIRYLRNMSFLQKLMLTFSLSLFLSVMLVLFRQISTTTKMLEDDSVRNLEVLTEQVIRNFDENQAGIQEATYSAMMSFDIPACMSGSGSSSLRANLAMMISAGSPYNYVMVRTEDGSYYGTGTSMDMDRQQQEAIGLECREILSEHDLNAYGVCQWLRSDSGEVYLLRDVYGISPMRYVGAMVIHMKDSFFSIRGSADTAFLFFDKQGNYITNAGMALDSQTLEDILRDVENSNISRQKTWNGETFFTYQCQGEKYDAIGINSTRFYQQAREKILRDGICVTIISLICGILLIYFISCSLLRKLKELNASMDKIAHGEFGSQIPVTNNDDISQLAVTFNYMSLRIKELLEQLVEKERQHNKAEMQVLEYKYRALETQIRPHFIYNAMDTISAMAKMKGDDDIVEIVQRISRYFRSITVNMTNQFITVQQEFDILKDYTEIYKFIHGDCLRTIFSAREAARNAMIPTMILQPVVENALHYGLRDQNEDSIIRIHAYVKEGSLFITVRDSGHGLTPEQTECLEKGQDLSRSGHSGIGLSNVRERLKLIYGEKGTITLRNRESGGVKATICIPFTFSEPDDMSCFDDMDELDGLREQDDWDELEKPG